MPVSHDERTSMIERRSSHESNTARAAEIEIPAGHERVVCPNCEAHVPFAVMNEHLDSCLLPSSSPHKKRPANEESHVLSRDDKATVKEETKSPVPRSKTRRTEHVRPFSERMRPQTLDEYVGQDDVVNGSLRALLHKGHIPSMVLWGPPGSGKTTLARLLTREAITTTNHTPFRFVELSATTATANDVKRIVEEAVNRQMLTTQRTVLFIDEIQRFNRAQQDLFLPMLERGLITLLAATTENPSFRLQGALLSRLRVVVLTKLSECDCLHILRNALARVRTGEDDVFDAASYEWIDDSLLQWMAQMADGDARAALQALELALVRDDGAERERLKASLRRTALKYDRAGDAHYDTISALHKSIRGSNPDAALYWLARMVAGGDDPLFIARRLIVCASEDCCSADALALATATYRACEIVGLPECGINLSHCVVALAESPKSTRSYRAWKKALSKVESEFNVRLCACLTVSAVSRTAAYSQWSYTHDARTRLRSTVSL